MDLRNLSTSDLIKLQEEAKSRLNTAKQDLKDINSAISDSYVLRVEQAYNQADKDYGIVRFDTGDGYEAVVKVDRRIDWDQARLKGLINNDWENLRHWVEIKADIPASKLKHMPSGALKTAVEECMTVKYSAPKLEFTKKE